VVIFFFTFVVLVVTHNIRIIYILIFIVITSYTYTRGEFSTRKPFKFRRTANPHAGFIIYYVYLYNNNNTYRIRDEVSKPKTGTSRLFGILLSYTHTHTHMIYAHRELVRRKSGNQAAVVLSYGAYNNITYTLRACACTCV